MNAEGVSSLSISGFTGNSVSLRLAETPQVTLRNNGVRLWHIVASEAAELRVDNASMSAGKVDLSGRVTLTVID
jgi:hypothetical protein